MKIILLLLPTLTLAQYNFTKSEVDHAFNMCQGFKHDAEKWEAAYSETLSDLRAANDSITTYADQIKLAATKNELLTDRYGALMQEYGKFKERNRNWGLSITGGPALVYASGNVYAGVGVTVGISRTLIRF